MTAFYIALSAWVVYEICKYFQLAKYRPAPKVVILAHMTETVWVGALFYFLNTAINAINEAFGLVFATFSKVGLM